MLCSCFMPTCNICGGGSADQAMAPVCSCFLLTCSQCSPGAAEPSDKEEEASTEQEMSSDSEREAPVSLKYSSDSSKCLAGITAAGPKCMCFMPGCGECTKDTPACEASTSGQPPSKHRRRKRRELPAGHSKCSLSEELEIDARMHAGSHGHHAAHAARCAVLAAAILSVVQPSLTALETIGRPRGERWDFVEIYAGCANLTAAVVALGLVAGPAVDLHKPHGLRLDCLLESSQALLQAVLAEARPRWVHVGPPCTFWTPMSRWTGHGTQERWSAKREAARRHWSFALHLLSLQESRGDNGSLEQPPRCASWKLRMTQDFQQAYPAWTFCKFPSCAYGMKNPGTGEPWEKMQGCLCNVSLDLMQLRCVCTVPHGHVHGNVKGGPRDGERCSTVAGAYPPRMCAALAAIIKSHVSGK